MRRPLVAAAALVLLVSGCAQQTQGTPTPGDETTVSTEAPPETTTTTEDEETGLADVDPCTIVDQAGLDSIGLTGGEGKSIGGARVCRYRHEGASISESYTVSVEVFDENGVEDLAASTTVQELPNVGSHEAVSFVDAAGVCGVSLAVGTDARVDNTAVGGDQQQGCQLAAQLAALVEPKLP